MPAAVVFEGELAGGAGGVPTAGVDDCTERREARGSLQASGICATNVERKKNKLSTSAIVVFLQMQKGRKPLQSNTSLLLDSLLTQSSDFIFYLLFLQ